MGWLSRVGSGIADVAGDTANGVGDILGSVTGVTQAHAATRAAKLQAAAAEKANLTARDMYDQSRADQKPFLDIGTRAAQDLDAKMKSGAFDPGKFDVKFNGPKYTPYDPGKPIDPFSYREFDPNAVAQEPGYQFGLKQGLDATQNSAAARGMLHSGNTLTGLNKYAQDYAGTKLGDAYNRYMQGRQEASNEYGQKVSQYNADRNFGAAQHDQNYNTLYGAATDEYNRGVGAYNTNAAASSSRFDNLARIAGYGQQASAQNGAQGSNFATSYGNNLTGAANAQAAGIVGAANAGANTAQNLLNFGSSIYANRNK